MFKIIFNSFLQSFSVKQYLLNDITFIAIYFIADKKNKKHNKGRLNKEKPKRFNIDKQLRRDTESSTSSYTRDYEKKMQMKDERRLYDLLKY